MEFPRQEYWRVLPFPSPGDPPDPRSEPRRHGNPHICYFSLIHDDAVLFYITLPTYVANSFNIILKVLVVQLCLTLCNLKECILPGSSVHRILQARLPSPGYLPNPGTEPGSPPFQADYLLSELPGKPRRIIISVLIILPNLYLKPPSTKQRHLALDVSPFQSITDTLVSRLGSANYCLFFFVHKVLLEQSQAQLLIYLWLLLCYDGEVE